MPFGARRDRVIVELRTPRLGSYWINDEIYIYKALAALVARICPVLRLAQDFPDEESGA
jgi:hypothetical protein